jgi:hypothetical protein
MSTSTIHIISIEGVAMATQQYVLFIVSLYMSLSTLNTLGSSYKVPEILCPINQIWILSAAFNKSHHYQILRKSVQREFRHVTKLVEAFREYANAPKNRLTTRMCL